MVNEQTNRYQILEENSSSEGDDDFTPNERDETQSIILIQGQGEGSSVMSSDMCLDYLFIITLTKRIHERFEDVEMVNLIQFFDTFDFEEIPSDQLERYIQTLFENDDTNMERFWAELGFDAFLP